MTLPPVLASPVGRAALLVGGQALVLVGFGLVYAVAGLRAQAQSRVGAELGALLIVLAGVGLLLVARGLLRRRRWARSPAVAVQLVTLLTALSLMSTPLAPAATVALLAAVVVVYLLFTGPARAELDPPHGAG